MTKALLPEWESFIRKRRSELFVDVFVSKYPPLISCMAYFEYSRILFETGYGTDYSQHPTNPFKKL